MAPLPGPTDQPTADIDATFKQAEVLHRQGRLADAQRLYNDILRAFPNHFGARHLLGIIAYQTGAIEQSIQLITSAIEIDGGVANAHNNLGNAFLSAQRPAEALASYNTAIALDPRHARAFCNRSVALRLLGRSQEAIRSCDQAIALDAGSAEAYCNRGSALVDQKQSAQALSDFDRAIGLKPDYAEAYCNRGAALIELGRHADAVASTEKAIALRPTYAEAHCNRGNALVGLERLEEAIAGYDRALALSPALAEAWLGRANALAAQQRYDSAIDSYGRALAVKAGFVAAWLGRANALVNLGRYDEALGDYDRALTLSPEHDGIMVSRGNVLIELKRYDEADAAYRNALAIDPGKAGVWLGRGNLFYAIKRYEEATRSYDRALEIDPALAGAWLGRGNLYRELGRHDEALGAYQTALALNPRLAEAWVGRGVLHQELMQLDEAELAYDNAIAIKQTLADAQFNKALLLLLRGRYEEGWRLYESRWATRDQRQYRRRFPRPLWLGKESLRGRSLLLYAEQGLGDAIQFARYAEVVSELGGKVILEAPKALIGLLASLKGVTRLVEAGTSLPHFDYHCPLLSLPLAMGTTLSTIPSPDAYLNADQRQCALWRDRLGQRDRPRIGVVWSSGFHPDQPELWRTNERRNIPLKDFAPLRDTDAVFYSLQKGAGAEQLDDVKAANWDGPDIVDYTSDLHDFADTAALMANLDLVISVDTASAHLAGALGRPVWVLSRFDADWRWGSSGIKTPWYASATVYRQTKPGDWTDIVQRVTADLKRFSRQP